MRKQIVKNRSELANKLAKLEGGKSEAKIGDIRQLFKILIRMEAEGINKGRKSLFMLLRRESVALAKKLKK